MTRKSNWKVWYETQYTKTNKERRSYVTKSLTNFHSGIHERGDVRSATTLKCDSTVDWPFGLYSEVIKKTRRK